MCSFWGCIIILVWVLVVCIRYHMFTSKNRECVCMYVFVLISRHEYDFGIRNTYDKNIDVRRYIYAYIHMFHNKIEMERLKHVHISERGYRQREGFLPLRSVVAVLR